METGFGKWTITGEPHERCVIRSKKSFLVWIGTLFHNFYSITLISHELHSLCNYSQGWGWLTEFLVRQMFQPMPVNRWRNMLPDLQYFYECFPWI